MAPPRMPSKFDSKLFRFVMAATTCAVMGMVCVSLAAPNGYVSPVYLAAGLGVAYALGWGASMFWPVWLAGTIVTLHFSWMSGATDLLGKPLWQALLIGGGAALQVLVARALARWVEPGPLDLTRPSRAVRFLLLVGPIACLTSASVACMTMVMLNGLPWQAAPHIFVGWWAGDALGVLVGVPIMLPMVAQPAEVWRPRRRSVALPLAITALALTLSIRQVQDWEIERKDAVFAQAVESTAKAVDLRLTGYMHAVESMAGLVEASDEVTRSEFKQASHYWLNSLGGVQALGWEARVAASALASFESRQRQSGLPDYRTFDEGRVPPAGDEVVAITYAEPQDKNLRAFGFNLLSRPASRKAYERARDTGMAVASQAMKLAQESGHQRGVAVYRAIYQGKTESIEERRRAAIGAVFLAVRMDDMMQSMMEGAPAYIDACLFEYAEGQRQLLGGDAVCHAGVPASAKVHRTVVPISFAQRTWELDIWAKGPIPIPGGGGTYWLAAAGGAFLSTALAALLLAMTGHTRRLEQARDEAKELARQAEAANRAKSDFLSRMSHELRTPLNAVLGFAQVMELDKQNPLEGAQLRRTKQIQQAGWHLLDMIDDVLDLSRMDTGTLRLETTAIPLTEALQSVANLFDEMARKQGIHLNWPDQVPASWGVQADATRLRQILTNLVSNAIKYNKPDGSVTVRVQQSRDAQGHPLTHFIVADTGLGMSDQQLSSLFQPFNRLGRERNTPDGTGIGLVISRHLAALMGGTLEVSSQDHVGSTFTLTLPAANVQMPETPATTAVFQDATTAPRAAPAPKHVLYIEDNQVNGELIRVALMTRPDLTVTVTPTSEEGLALLKQHTQTRRPDLILLDMHLPDVPGMEVLHILKSQPETSKIPVLVISADALPAQIEAAKQAGALDYITKPVNMPKLLAQINDLLDH